MATPNYEIDYNDKRFTDVKTAETNAVNKSNTFYNDAVDKIDNQINTQIGNVKDWGAEQAKNQQAQHDFTIQQIEQKKEQAQQDYKKEQSAAYVDWQKQSNKYGANAEQMAAQGMSNTGYSESSKVAMYNQYQNRVAVAREAISRAELEFDNQMTQARLQNSSILAEIAYNTLKEIDSLTLAGIQQTTALRSEQAKRETEIKQIYHNQWQDVLKQIQDEQKQVYILPDTTPSDEITDDSPEIQLTPDIAPTTNNTKPTLYPKYSVAGALREMSGAGEGDLAKIDKSTLTNKGYGNLSAEELAEMVNEGTLVPVVKNGKIEFQKPLSAGAGTKQWLTQHMK